MGIRCYPGNILGLSFLTSLMVGMDTQFAPANGIRVYTCVSLLDGRLKNQYVICHAFFSQSIHPHPYHC